MYGSAGVGSGSGAEPSPAAALALEPDLGRGPGPWIWLRHLVADLAPTVNLDPAPAANPDPAATPDLATDLAPILDPATVSVPAANPDSGPAGRLPRRLGRRHQRDHAAQKHDLRPPALRGHAEIQALVLRALRYLPGEEGVAPIGPRGREHLDLPPVEQGLDLLLRQPHGRGGGDHLRAHGPAADAPRAQAVDRRLVETGHGAERPGNEMQLVLDDQVGRPRMVRVAAVEETRRLAGPRQRRELVGGRDHERGQAAVDRLVHRHDGQGALPGEVAVPVDAVDEQIGRLVGVRMQPERLPFERGAAPGALLQGATAVRARSRAHSAGSSPGPKCRRPRPGGPCSSGWPRARPTGRSRRATRPAAPAPARVRAPGRRSAPRPGRAGRASAAAACSASAPTAPAHKGRGRQGCDRKGCGHEVRGRQDRGQQDRGRRNPDGAGGGAQG